MSIFGSGTNNLLKTGTSTAFGSSAFGNPGGNQQQPATGSALFGQQPQQQTTTFGQPATTGTTSIFGQPQAATTGQTTNIFGQSQQPATTGNNLFGQTQQPAATGTTNIFSQTQQQPATTGTSLFGQTQQQQPAAGTSLFGQTQQPATGTSLFGQTQQPTSGQPATSTGTGLFGQSQQQPVNTGTGPFGQTQQQPTNTGTNLFGQTQQQPTNTGTSLFGQTQQQPANTGTSLFGQQQQQQQPATSLFGSSTAQPSTGLFGSTNQQQNQPVQQTSLFGNNNASTNSLFGKPQGSIFGAASTQPQQMTTGNLLPGTQPQNQQKGAFGGSNLFQNSVNTTNPLTMSSLQPSGSALGSSTLLALQRASQTQADPQVQFARLQEKIESIYQAWNPASPHCRFQRCFYNLVDPSQINLYTRPLNVTNDALWQKAVRENPDPSCLVPVVAIGFDDLRERVEAQSRQAAGHQEGIKDIQSRLQALSVRHTTSTVPRLARFSTEQMQLTLRLMAFIQHLHLLIPTVRSSSIRPEEEELRKKLEEVQEVIRGGGGRMRAKLGEFWAVLGAVKAREGGKTGSTRGGEWKVVDEEGLARITQILADQQAGLQHLTKILQKDLQDLGIILGTRPPGVSDESVDANTLFSSMNASGFRR